MVPDIAGLLNHLSQKRIVDNYSLEMFFQKKLDFGDEYKIDKLLTFEQNVQHHSLFLQLMHQIIQTTTEGNHRTFVALRILQGHSIEDNLPFQPYSITRSSLGDKEVTINRPVNIDIVFFHQKNYPLQ